MGHWMRRLLTSAILPLFLSGCSTAPRSFTPVLEDSAVAGPDFDASLERCTQLVNAGVRSDFRNHPLTAAAAGAAAGYGAGAVVFYSALGSGAIATAASATMVVMPVVGIAVAATYAHAARARRERDIQDALSRCLSEEGYTVHHWRLERRRSPVVATDAPQ